jgi:NADH dehydrogenase
LFVVDQNLRTSCPDIFALGDCAAFTLPDGKRVPASAQAAHQQAVYLARNLDAVARGAIVSPFAYRNFGALVSLGSDTSVIGTLMGFVSGKNYRIRGFIAMLFYRWLYFRHRAAILGWVPATLESLGQSLARASRPQVKLH